ncbi:HPr family phosphocarrier protein [Anaerofustis stercorihominis]|uniref:HPr family phosphocarrier protein n=1 Tax=Anaerofustis stercorihominis TaxID=214853 RepID=UPI00214A972E|nr:HPr family phosphocarrier protein [Anaerofustis stercorihominis]MCR2032940.1 HPr family phosphocarrier protein [Anaerofustis stercorihominis]
MIYSTTVKNETGIHARPAKVLVQEASKFVSDIKIKANDISVNCKSIMSVLALGATKGTNVEIDISGEDEKDAYNAIKYLFENNLNEPK